MEIFLNLQLKFFNLYKLLFLGHNPINAYFVMKPIDDLKLFNTSNAINPLIYNLCFKHFKTPKLILPIKLGFLKT
jgi:hypothetical protein